jgi:hypothetical protein
MSVLKLAKQESLYVHFSDMNKLYLKNVSEVWKTCIPQMSKIGKLGIAVVATRRRYLKKKLNYEISDIHSANRKYLLWMLC